MDTTAGWVPAVCPHDCPSACALEVERLDARSIGRLRGARDNDYTRGVICAKVARYAERVHHPQRLRVPLKRSGPRGSGKFTPIGWDQALDEVAEAFQRVAGSLGPEAVWPYYYAGTMGQVQRDGINRLRHVLGYSGMQKSICTSIAYAGWNAGVGAERGSDPREIAHSDLVVIWGCNAVATQINLMTHVARARRRGARLVVIDPCRTATAEKADLHLMLRPGSDGALACAVMHLLFKQGYADLDYLHRYAAIPDQFHTVLAQQTPEWAAEITGLPVAQIHRFARLYGENRRSFIRLGIGFSRSRNGAHNVHAVSCLPVVTGAWQYRGGGALLGSSGLFRLDKTLIEGLDARDPSVRVLDMSRIGPILCGDTADLQGGPPVGALLIQNSNPLAVAPELAAVNQGFQRRDLFVCVHEQFMTDTARMADILLPATTFLEHDDLYQSYGQVHLQLGRRVIEPFAESRSNHRLICDLARRLGAEHPGFGMDALTLIDRTLQASGYPDLRQLEARRWHDCALPFEEMNFIRGFGWPDGRFRFAPDWSRLGPAGREIPPLPGHWAVTEAVDELHPFRLITPPARNFLNTTFTETGYAQRREGAPAVQIHPRDAASLGIETGMQVVLGNRRGRVRLVARCSDRVPAGVVAVEGIWPGSAFPGGQGINHLVGADAVAPAGGAAFHDVAVWIRPYAPDTGDSGGERS